MTHNTSIGEAVLAQCDQLATFSDHPDYLCRAYLTPEHRAANDQVAQWMKDIDMTTWEDAAGNLWGRFPGRTDSPALVVGSHLDTVRNAGRYDGMLGVLTPLAALAQLHAADERPAMPVEIVAFADEEGTRFGTTLLGSRAVTGRWQRAWHDIEDAEGVSLGQALIDFGLDPEHMDTAARKPEELAAYVELHIEQGPVLEAENLPLGVVTSINGARRLRLTVDGQAGHAGTVPMHLRQDALCGASELILLAERLALEHQVVATAGFVQAYPGSVNVVPGRCEFTLDIRSEDDARRDAMIDAWEQEAHVRIEQRGLRLSREDIHHANAVPCDPALQNRLAEVLTQIGQPDFRLPSGAGHDAMAMADITPVGMLFLRCDGGVSHNPAEAVQAEDVALGVDALTVLLREGL